MRHCIIGSCALIKPQVRQWLIMIVTVKVSDLKKWVKAGGVKKDLALYCGYEDDQPVRKWIIRGRIPRFQQKRVLEFLNGLKN